VSLLIDVMHLLVIAVGIGIGAWALIALIAGEDEVSEAAMRGARWLSERQNDDGGDGQQKCGKAGQGEDKCH
jgi:hypothetical protein